MIYGESSEVTRAAKNTLSATAKFFLIVVAIVGSMVVLTVERKADYESTALCLYMQKSEQYVEARTAHFEKSELSEGRTVTYVHEGIVPVSQYLCVVSVRGSKVTAVRTMHSWTIL